MDKPRVDFLKKPFLFQDQNSIKYWKVILNGILNYFITFIYKCVLANRLALTHLKIKLPTNPSLTNRVYMCNKLPVCKWLMLNQKCFKPVYK